LLLAIPDPARERKLFPIEIPKLGSFIASGNWTARETGLESFPVEDRSPGLGYALLGASWLVLKSEGDLHD
jgi:cytochrome bd-type quinol oxidase subunit 1